MLAYWLTAVSLLAYLVFVWFLGTWLNLEGGKIWILRGVLALLGIAAAGVFLWYNRKLLSEKSDGSDLADQDIELDLLMRDAMRRLKSSTLGRRANLRSSPVIFLIGPPDRRKRQL